MELWHLVSYIVYIDGLAAERHRHERHSEKIRYDTIRYDTIQYDTINANLCLCAYLYIYMFVWMDDDYVQQLWIAL